MIELEASTKPDVLNKLKPLLESYKGETTVEIHIPGEHSLKRVKVPFGVDVANPNSKVN